MAKCYTQKNADRVFYSITRVVGGSEFGGNPLDVMLLQYLLNRVYENDPLGPYGAKRPLAIDGVIGAQTHYRLLYFVLFNFGEEEDSDLKPSITGTRINPIMHAHPGMSLTEIVASPMGRLAVHAFVKGDKPTPAHVTLPDMPAMLAQELKTNVIAL